MSLSYHPLDVFTDRAGALITALRLLGHAVRVAAGRLL